MRFVALAVAVSVACGSCSPALAACRLEWLCTGEGACEHVMRLGRSGRSSRSEACCCVDKSRNPDASRPFAHIVRCDDPHAQPGAPSGR